MKRNRSLSPPRGYQRREPTPEEKEQPNYTPSGILAENQRQTASGVILKYSAPPESRPPTTAFRLVVFKKEEHIETHSLDRLESYLIGRDSAVCDILLDNPSLSKQHAVIQYRLLEGASTTVLYIIFI